MATTNFNNDIIITETLAVSGSVGIGSTSLTGYNLRASKNITGATLAYGVFQQGAVQNDVTTAHGFHNESNTAASSFTLSNYRHFFVAQGTFGAGSSVTSQFGFAVDSSMTGATNNYGFRGAIGAGSNRWNIYMDGTADNYLAGALGIGSTNLTGINLRITKNITGLTTSYGILQDPVIQSGVTTAAFINRSLPYTATAAFTLGSLYHFAATQGVLGAGSTVTNQYGFFVDSATIGATNNYGFYGDIPAATNDWNIYMNGTANNYLGGNLGIKKTVPSVELDVSGSVLVTGSLFISSSAVAATVQGSGSAVFSVNGTVGRLFQVDDSLTGSLFSVNTSAGLPVIEAFSDNTVRIGQYGQKVLYVSQSKVGIGKENALNGILDVSGSTTITGSLNVTSSLTVEGSTTLRRASASGVRLVFENIGVDSYGIGMPPTTADFAFYSSNTTERMRLTSGGSLGIGSNTLTGITLRVAKTITGATTSYGVLQQGIVQSDVTTTAFGYYNEIGTQAAAFTLTNYRHFFATASTIGAGSTVTNQVGFFVSSTVTGATNNFAFYGDIAAAANRWNLYMNGTANNYLAGSLGIGNTSLTGINLRIQKDITGGTAAYGVIQGGTVLSDVTSQAWGFNNSLTTQASAFTLTHYYHYASSQSTIGATSAVTNQYGFYVFNSLTGATNNYGFYGNLAAASNVWNLYMNGTAGNYLAGALAIGNTSTSQVNLGVNRNLSGNSTMYGITSFGAIQSDVTTRANYFATYGSIQNTTFTLGALNHYIADSTGTVGSATITNQYGFNVTNALTAATNNYGFYGDIASGANRWNLFMNGTANNYMAGNLGLGTTTPATNAKQTIMGNLTFGLPGNGTNTSGRFISIEGNTDASGEGSSRIFFAEHNSSTAAMDSYGMSLGYRGGDTSIVGASGNTWTGLSLISNGEWGMWGHDNNSTGSLIMYGDRVATFINLSNNDLNNVGNAYFNGNVGVGKVTPTVKLDVNGNVLVTGSINATADITAFSTSDIRFKENIQYIPNALEKLDKIHGYTFDWKSDEDLVSLHNFKGHDVGVIAQEIEEILPEVVATRDNGYKAVKYEKLTAFLIQVVKELKADNEDLRNEINNLKNK